MRIISVSIHLFYYADKNMIIIIIKEYQSLRPKVSSSQIKKSPRPINKVTSSDIFKRVTSSEKSSHFVRKFKKLINILVRNMISYLFIPDEYNYNI